MRELEDVVVVDLLGVHAVVEKLPEDYGDLQDVVRVRGDLHGLDHWVVELLEDDDVVVGAALPAKH